MRNREVIGTIRQLLLTMAGFLCAIVLLDSGQLAHWANTLDAGPLRSAAVPVTSALQRALHPLGLDTLHANALDTLARAGWTDDAALIARAKNPSRSGIAALNPTCSVPAASGTSIASAHPTAIPGRSNPVRTSSATASSSAPGAAVALAPVVPRSTNLEPLTPVPLGQKRVIALAGDSMMAVGLSATFMRQAANHPNLHLVKAFQSGTGLARPEIFDWSEEYPAMIGAQSPDIVIVAIGANDGQGFVVDGKVYPYGSPEWLKIYQRRLADYLAMVSSSGARVVWIALPPMRSAAYNEKIATINRIAYTVVSQNPHATWWNPVAAIGDDSGNFREFEALANGRSMRIRAADGIHLSDEGAGLLTSTLIPWLDPPVQTAAVSAPAKPVPAPAPATHPATLKRRSRRGNKS